VKHDETRGIYTKEGIYHLQLPMVKGIRPKPVNLQTKELVEAIARAVQVRKLPSLTPSTGLKAEVARFLKYKKDRRAYSRATAKSKGYTLGAWVASLPANTMPHMVTTDQLQGYYNAILAKHTPATAHKALMDIQAFFRWELETEKKVRTNPAVGVATEPVPDSARPLFCSRELQDRLINECPREDLKLVLLLGFDAGLRKNEIIQAVPGWFHLDRHSIDLTPTPTMPFNKYKKPRTIPMRARLYDFLQTYGLREPFMLRPEVKQGKDIYRYDFDVALQNYVRAQGVPWMTAHVMRHTFASLLVQGNTSIFKVATWLGDTVRVTEKHYAHLAPKDSDIELPAPKTKRQLSAAGQGTLPL
jgi:integrase